jgi:hypothetical protein
MIRLLVDEDFNNDLVRGLLRRALGTDLVRVQDLGLRGSPDQEVLARAALEGRIVLAHDRATLIARAYERITRGQPMPGVIAVPQSLPLGHVIQDLLLIVECSSMGDWNAQVYTCRCGDGSLESLLGFWFAA